MESYTIGDLEIIFDFAGRNDWGKFSFLTWYGIPVKIKWKDYEFDFNLRGNLKRIRGRLSVWPNPLEQLKRTDANDLVYYGDFGYQFSHDLIKNHYFPHTGRHNSKIFKQRPLESFHVKEAIATFDQLVKRAGEFSSIAEDERPKEFLAKVATRSREVLFRDAQKLHEIIGGELPILPPDTINVDYEVLPIMVSEGCAYNCSFCLFKTNGNFQVRSRENIEKQIFAMKEMYREDLINYNSLVLGQNDALAAGEELLKGTALFAYEVLKLGDSFHRGRPNLFFFGGVKSFLIASEIMFEMLDSLPYTVYINVGLESPDEETLNYLGKPLGASHVKEAFKKIQLVNGNFSNIEVTCNFVLGEYLSGRHLEAVKNLLSEAGPRKGKGTIYLSPLIGASNRRQILKEVREVKRISPFPVYLYLVQRL